MLNCFRTKNANDDFADYCGKYTREDNSELMAYRVFLLGYATDIVPNPIKIDTLLTLVTRCTGQKIYYDAREALHYIKMGRPQDEITLDARVSRQMRKYSTSIGGLSDRIIADIGEWIGIIS